MSVVADVDAYVVHRIDELNEEIRVLEEAKAALLGEHLPARKRRAGTASSAEKARKGTRLDQTLDLIRRHPGIGTKEIGEKLGLHPTQPYVIVRQLRDRELILRGEDGGWYREIK